VKILLISPLARAGARTPPAIRVPEIALHVIKALTPPEHDVRIVEEESEDIDLDADCDLVGISCMSANAVRAYAIADEFRSRGRKVVLGGIHPTVLPAEAGRHADAVVVGEAEASWKTLLDDASRGNLASVYTGEPTDLRDFPVVTLKHENEQARFAGITPVLTTKGCPYSCEFCCVGAVHGNRVRHIPIPTVIESIRASGQRTFLFLDDNVIADRQYARELFTRLMPLGIRWVGQSSISFASDVDLLRLAARSGCYALFVGLESVVPETLSTMPKSRPPDQSRAAIDAFRAAGIGFHASVVFGFDTDDHTVFERTVEFLRAAKVHSASFNVLTPYPGTKLFARLDAESRLLTKDWQKYDHKTVVYRPRQIAPDALEAGYLMARQSFYSWSSITARLFRNRKHPLVYLGMNAALRSGVRADQKAFDAARAQGTMAEFESAQSRT
jgi:radical SAM superfamily enzyme YgiQ (UPF0313 family)